MNFDIHLLTNTDKFSYAATCEETGHVIYFAENYLQVLPPGSIRFPKDDQLPTTRTFDLDCKFLDALVGDHMGKLTFSMLVRLDGSRHITIKYYNEKGETKRVIEIRPEISPEINKVLSVVYPIMEEIHEKAFDKAED